MSQPQPKRDQEAEDIIEDVPDEAVASTAAADATEDTEECGWCRWMKGGGCKESFQSWQDCVDEVSEAGTNDAPSKCAQQMDALLTCMVQNKEYYRDQLDAMFGTSDEDSKGDKAPAGSEERGSTPEKKDSEPTTDQAKAA